MNRFSKAFSILGLSALMVAPLLATPADIELAVINFAERHKVEFEMVPSHRVPGVRIRTKVEFEEGQNRIEISWAHMLPAVVFGGDITCYVLWAINREGTYENLGEFWVRPGRNSDKMEYSTGLRNFALMVTAEAYYLVRQPSPMVVTYNQPSEDSRAPATPLIFSDFGPLPKSDRETLDLATYDSKAPLDILQAERVLEIARGLGASQYAADIFQEADIRLQQARQMAKSSRSQRGSQEFARKSVAASNDAIQISLRRQEAEKAEAEVRASQMELDRIRREKTTVESEKAAIESEKSALEAALGDLRQETQRLEREKGVLEGRLQGALSQVAETRESARGYIINLPDILFDIGQATLKPEARQLMARLAGILLIMQDHNLQVEGHTDSTGSFQYNLLLSESRARSVVNFMAQQGIDGERMIAIGYGFDRPIADNFTPQGRSRNRRVEIILSETEMASLPGRYDR
ncbi:MAG: OmpA family protein [Acidobacteria bacterium]|nr:OmpA family protein [Acidobacteriota bacterium]